MESAKARVKDFIGKAGHNDSTVHETVNPAVTDETVTQTQHEHVRPALDKEIHQDHYHTTVQPIADREVLPEQHHHREVATEHKSFEHDNAENTKARVAAEAAQFQDQSRTIQSDGTSEQHSVLGGEHTHHHVHENIQPVIQKETIEPHVVHTTVPVHEVHHNEAKHHSATALPTVSMDEFKKQGGTLGGREERTDAFQGDPKYVRGNDENVPAT